MCLTTEFNYVRTTEGENSKIIRSKTTQVYSTGNIPQHCSTKYILLAGVYPIVLKGEGGARGHNIISKTMKIGLPTFNDYSYKNKHADYH